MAPEQDLRGFPNVHLKLQKPTKQSAFDKQKAADEAKRQREEAETAEAYREFIKDFAGPEDDSRKHDGNRMGSFGGAAFPPRGAPTGPGATKRHFGTSSLKSGPGSLGPAPAAFGKKRSFQDFAKSQRDGVSGASSVQKAFDNSDDDEDMSGPVDRAEVKAIAKPTLRLSNLPPAASPSLIKAAMPDNITVDSVSIQPPTGPIGSERKSAVAIVTLSRETPLNEIEAAVNTLQNRYMGYGHYLSLHRHLSSAVTSLTATSGLPMGNADSNPFGAKLAPKPDEKQAERDRQLQRGFAPPTTYDAPTNDISRKGILHVPVNPPGDIKEVQLINMAIEGLLDHGPEYEALLMSKPEVQNDEKWAWLWNARSQGGIWYRWRLWEIMTSAEDDREKGKFIPLFEEGSAWQTPDKSLPFEYNTGVDEFVSDPDYHSSDEEGMDDEAKENKGQDDKVFLNPLDKANLVHLLARLPTTLAKLRKGDIARPSTFAISHANRGIDEVVDIILSNLEHPYSLTAANPTYEKESKASAEQEGDNAQNEGADASGARLVALYVVNDILASSSTSGIRQAWRFRQLFETAIKERNVFELLGTMPETLKWGRMRTDKWKRSINLVLNLWEGWSIFPKESQEYFVSSFEKTPPEAEKKPEEVQRKGKWKIMSSNPTTENTLSTETLTLPTAQELTAQKVAGKDETGGKSIGENNAAREPTMEANIAAKPIFEDGIKGETTEQDQVQGPQAIPATGKAEVPKEHQDDDTGRSSALKGATRKTRMRAVDMFANSDDSDGA